MVSKFEVNNNNLIESIKKQDENSNSQNLLENRCCGSNISSNTDKSSKYSESLWNRSSSLNVSIENNSNGVICDINNLGYLKDFEKSSDLPVKKSVIYNTNESSVKVITTNESSVKVITTNESRASSTINNMLISNSKVKDCDKKLKNNNIFTDNVHEKQNSDFSTSKMSGVSPAVLSSDRIGRRSDSQQMNYRVSTSITETISNHSRDTIDTAEREQNCQLPSSVYGSPASSVEKVLTGLQVVEHDKSNETSYGKVSFLQEILQKKSTESMSYDSFSKQLNFPQTEENSHKLQVTNTSNSSDTQINFLTESNFKNKTESAQPAKLKLHIPETFSNEDSNSSVLSSESQKPAKIPKITSPQILEQHISKIISENAAIVETLDPKWTRRYCKQSSLNSLLSSESDSKKLSFSLKSSRSEDSLIQCSVNEVSKLQSALLGESESESSTFAQKVIVSPHRTLSSNEKTLQYNNLSATIPPVNMYSKTVSPASDDDQKGSAIKSLLSFKKGRFSKNKTYFDKDIHNQHPQNPEGSIIKDLLLKSKSKDGSKFLVDVDDKQNSSYYLDGSNFFYKAPILKCPNCSSEFSEKYSLDVHLSFCKSATKPLYSLRDDTERVAVKQTSAQKITDFHVNTISHFTEDSQHSDAGVGTILKKQLLLPLSKSPPLKRRKISDSVLSGTYYTGHSIDKSHFKEANRTILPASLGSMSSLQHRSRSHSVHLFGGEVQILDGDRTKRIKIKTSLPGAFSPISNKFADSFIPKRPEFKDDKDANSMPSVVVTIAQPVHNSGGIVHVPNHRSPSVSPIVTIASSLSDGIMKYTRSISSDYTKMNSSELLKTDAHKDSLLLNLSNAPIAFLPGPESKFLYATNSGLPISFSNISKNEEFRPGSIVEEISPTAIRVPVSPGNKPFYSPIFSTEEKSFESTIVSYHKEKNSHDNREVPTVVFTPSSPTLPTTDSEVSPISSTNISEPAKKFLAPTRPTSLPLKKKPFTMVGSTLISPETPRPKKTCIQLYLNGHAYTYLGLKCSTRSTYCCIYRPQPMFVLQETNPKLSMYSNWQVVPAKEELLGLTPGQMISLYNSKQKKELQSVIATAKLGEPLIFTHSSYWTYRSSDQSGNKTITDEKTNESEENKLLHETDQVNCTKSCTYIFFDCIKTELIYLLTFLFLIILF